MAGFNGLQCPLYFVDIKFHCSFAFNRHVRDLLVYACANVNLNLSRLRPDNLSWHNKVCRKDIVIGLTLDRRVKIRE